MSNTRKVYAAQPKWDGNKAPKYGSEEWPRVTPEEVEKARLVFWDIFMVENEGDHYNEFAAALGCTRARAKQVYYYLLYQKGHLQNQMAQERKVRSKLAGRIRKYTEFLENPETIYQILCRAEDEVDDDAGKKLKRADKC